MKSDVRVISAVYLLVMLTSSLTVARVVRPDFVRMNPDRDGFRGPDIGVNPGDPVRPSAGAILLILREQCRRLLEQDPKSVPFFCLQLLNGSRISSNEMNTQFDRFVDGNFGDQPQLARAGGNPRLGAAQA